MKHRMLVLSLFTTVLGSTLLGPSTGAPVFEPSVAHAQAVPVVPPGCTGRSVRFYQRGIEQGRGLVRAAWVGVGQDFDMLDQFQNVIIENIERLTLPAGASDALICRYTGTVDGVYDELDALYEEVANQCFMDGEMIGEMAAEVYCELSLALGGLASADRFLRGPVYTCGVNFEIACDSKFMGESRAFTNALGACLPYTQGTFRQVWDDTRNNQCIYEPPPAPATESGDRLWGEGR